MLFKPSQGYTHPVAIPVERLIKARSDNLRDVKGIIYFNDITLSTDVRKGALVVTVDPPTKQQHTVNV